MLAKMQAGFRPREERITVLIPSRMRLGASWVDVVIHNVSSRGFMAGCDTPPEPGAYIEVRRGTIVLVGRVRWGKGRFFGVQTQDRISIKALIDEPRHASRPVKTDEHQAQERRAETRMMHEARMARRVERSRAFSSAFQYAIMGLAGLAAAGLGASFVYDSLVKPTATLSRALDVK
ncbi:PilZ domain-containing protein [Sphingomonas adhaesiva]|uniref:PilZ domain-containing protein n=1 Tax=Sphingomonas adhaesiva TaxID=28212 RepID=A0A2A4I9M0_9SPHN|nr:PilZ domain-containing protein [Sphingomonas adhaesiva]PCG14694.1 PilZ domain-containing protein [Sphingomonas adhaesiva]